MAADKTDVRQYLSTLIIQKLSQIACNTSVLRKLKLSKGELNSVTLLPSKKAKVRTRDPRVIFPAVRSI